MTNLKLSILTFLFTLAALFAESQNLFYFDYQIDSSRFNDLEKVNINAERNFKSFVFFDTPRIALTNSEAKELITDKSQYILDSKNEIRVYIQFNSSFDTLKILGYSTIYYIDDKSKIFYMLPLKVIELYVKPSTYMSITEVLYYSLRDFMKSGIDHRLIPIDYELKNEFEILKPFFYSFTQAEWRLYRDPFNEESMIKDRMEPHKFVSNSDSIYTSYNEFPFPEKIKYTLSTQVYLDSNIKFSSHELHYNNMSNMVVYFNYKHIGLEFKSNGITKSYWAFKNDIHYFINRNKTYRIACQLYFSSAIRSKFIPLDGYKIN